MGLRGTPNQERKAFADRTPKKRHATRKKVRLDDIAPEIPKDLLPEDKGLMGDLFWVYEQLGGKEALLKMLKDDARTKKDFLKTLLQHETKQLEKRGNGGAGKKGKLFIIKGLYDEGDGKGVAGKKYQNVLDPLSQKDSHAEAEEYAYQATEPEEIIIEDEVVIEETEVEEIA